MIWERLIIGDIIDFNNGKFVIVVGYGLMEKRNCVNDIWWD